MAKYRYTTKMTTSYQDMIKMASEVMNKDIEKRFKQFSVLAEEEIPEALIFAIKETEIYESLAYGNGSVDLRAEFGLDKSVDVNAIDEIIETLVGELHIQQAQLRKTSKGPSGTIAIEAIPRNMFEALSLKQSYITSGQYILPWLSWLSFEGDSIIIANYQVLKGEYDSPIPSRTGDAIMAKTKTGFWKVPAQYSGTKTDNWVTRAVEDGNNHINRVIVGLLNRTF